VCDEGYGRYGVTAEIASVIAEARSSIWKRRLNEWARCTFPFHFRRHWKMRRCPRAIRLRSCAENSAGDMATSVVMPALEMAQETGKIIRG
jgi:hypothetical protein